MDEASKSRRTELSGRGRLTAVVLAMLLAVPLAIAAGLRPDPHGAGTHTQLGFPPCTVRTLLGVPCPTCGMTTSWVHLMKGEPAEAFRANVGGTLLGMLAIMAVAWLTVSAVRGRWWVCPPHMKTSVGLAMALALITLADWVFRLLRW